MMHLADLIQEEMSERNWDLDDLVMYMGPFTEEERGICYFSWEMFFELHLPEVLLGEVMANQLSNAFGITPNFFTNFHEMWRSANTPKTVQGEPA